MLGNGTGEETAQSNEDIPLRNALASPHTNPQHKSKPSKDRLLQISSPAIHALTLKHKVPSTLVYRQPLAIACKNVVVVTDNYRFYYYLRTDTSICNVTFVIFALLSPLWYWV